MLNSAGRDQSHLREQTARFLPSQEPHLLAALRFYYSAALITRTNSLPVRMFTPTLWVGLARQIRIIGGGRSTGGGVDGESKPPTTAYARLSNAPPTTQLTMFADWTGVALSYVCDPCVLLNHSLCQS
jgi:hypothetical protein